MREISLARIGRPHGVRGALHINEVGQHLKNFLNKQVQVGEKKYTLAAFTESQLQFSEIRDRDAAAKLTNLMITVSQAELRAIVRAERNFSTQELGDLYYFEMIGLSVQDDESKRPIGSITHVEDMGHHAILTVTDESGIAFLVPLNYPYWGNLDDEKNTISLSEWNFLKESQSA